MQTLIPFKFITFNFEHFCHTQFNALKTSKLAKRNLPQPKQGEDEIWPHFLPKPRVEQ
jgi:hypothetical protein